jgi:hypothetical protein
MATGRGAQGLGQPGTFVAREELTIPDLPAVGGAGAPFPPIQGLYRDPEA